ncbi:MAG: zinc-binding dehydrogenase [Gemmatimonadetes bacterium]|nr:zinc-binding dehydrogenase [Gemmatimonadota bacterium]
MRAVRLVAPGRPLEAATVPVPEVGPGDVLVRVRAAGICHSDAHYRSGRAPSNPLPLTLGHEVAGTIERAGPGVTTHRAGDRVVLHYNVTCGHCARCAAGTEQFCAECRMLGHHRDGGYAEFIAVPAANAIPLPASIGFAPCATLMCASATSYHALRKGRLAAGETVAVFGAGGLGQSAVQIARAFGARTVLAVDINPARLALAERHGAIAIDARAGDPVAAIRSRTGGVDVALEVIGLAATMRQAVQSLGPFGRAVLVGLADQPMLLDTYGELLGKEAEVIGCNDHLLSELAPLLALAAGGALDVSQVVTRTVPLEAGAINAALDGLDGFQDGVRTVIEP